MHQARSLAKSWLAAAVVSVLILPQGADATPIIDQSYLVPTNSGRPGNPVTSENGIARSAAQTLTVGLTGLLTQIDLQIAGISAYLVTIEIGRGTNPNTDIVLASFNLTAPAWPELAQYPITSINVLSALLGVTAGDNLVLSLFSSSPVFGGWALGMPSDGTYAGGQAYQAAGTPLFALSSGDLAFRTWVDTQARAVPEPATLGLLGLTLAAISFVRRGPANHG